MMEEIPNTLWRNIQLLMSSLRGVFLSSSYSCCVWERNDHMTTAHCKGKTGSDVDRNGCQHRHSTVTQIFHQLQLVHSLFQPDTTHTHTHTGLLPQKMRNNSTISYYLWIPGNKGETGG